MAAVNCCGWRVMCKLRLLSEYVLAKHCTLWVEGDVQTLTSLRMCLSKALHAVYTLQLRSAQLAWCGVVCGVVWCGVVWCGAVRCGVVWCGVVWCGVVLCGVVLCGVVWCGVVWCDVVWYGVVWCGMVWCGVVQDMKS